MLTTASRAQLVARRLILSDVCSHDYSELVEQLMLVCGRRAMLLL